MGRWRSWFHPISVIGDRCSVIGLLFTDYGLPTTDNPQRRPLTEPTGHPYSCYPFPGITHGGFWLLSTGDGFQPTAVRSLTAVTTTTRPDQRITNVKLRQNYRKPLSIVKKKLTSNSPDNGRIPSHRHECPPLLLAAIGLHSQKSNPAASPRCAPAPHRYTSTNYRLPLALDTCSVRIHISCRDNLVQPHPLLW